VVHVVLRGVGADAKNAAQGLKRSPMPGGVKFAKINVGRAKKTAMAMPGNRICLLLYRSLFAAIADTISPLIQFATILRRTRE
jgi:hypothetical protein